MPHQGAVVGRRNVIGVFIRAAVHHGLCEQAQRDVAERTLRHDDVDQVVHRIVGRGPVLFAAVVRVDAVTGDRARVNGRAGLVRMRHFLRLVDDEQCSQRRTDQQPPADAVDEPEQVDQRVHGLVLFSDDFGVGHNLEPQQALFSDARVCSYSRTVADWMFFWRLSVTASIFPFIKSASVILYCAWPA